MNVKVSPCALKGNIRAISSKSDAHRLLILSALSGSPVFLELNVFSKDILATADCLCALGADIKRTDKGFHVTPIKNVPAEALLNCMESGSTLRFMLPVAAALGVKARFTGEGRLPSRPIGELKKVMEQHGVRFSSDKLPLTVEGKLTPGEYAIPGNISSQYLTGLMLALPLVGESTVKLTAKLESVGYVDMTVSALKKFGAEVTKCGEEFKIPYTGYKSPEKLCVEGDWSNSAFFLVAGALAGGITVTGLDTHSSQADKAVVDILLKMGADVSVKGNAVRVCPAPLSGCDIDVSNIPDLLPVLAVAASYAKGQTRFTNAARLRIKESDRLFSTASMINSLGGNAVEYPDSLTVEGSFLKGGVTDSFNDHRIVMSAAIAAMKCENDVVIKCAEAVNKSYPAFFEDIISLGGKADVI